MITPFLLSTLDLAIVFHIGLTENADLEAEFFYLDIFNCH